jgi:hypothetical protein
LVSACSAGYAVSVKDQPYPEIARDRIKSTLLIDKLQNHILEGAEHPMSKTQVSAAIALLKKTVPDLQSIEAVHRGDAAHPIMISSTDSQL